MPQFLKYLLVGGSAALLEYGVFLASLEVLTANVYLAHAFGFVLGLLFSFVLNKFYVFSGPQVQQAQRQFVLYAALALLNLLLGAVLLGLLIRYANLAPWLAKGMSMVAIALWNFIIYKKVIYR